MPGPLLTTKLYIPQPRPGLVLRQRLIDLLNLGAQRRLALLSAPAGYGKTTLVSAWVRQQTLPAGWVTLDEGDNDTGRFLAYLITALKSIGVDTDEQVLSLLHPGGSRQTGYHPLDNVLIPLINQISSCPKDFILVLDDYHTIEEQPVHQALNYLLDHAPASIHFVLLTRADPPFSLSHLGLSGELVEMRAAQLRFTPDEALELLNLELELRLTREDAQSLVERADGWAAALQMMAVTLKERQKAGESIPDFSGKQTYIADYLTDEVIGRQPERVGDFLLKTSILERLCAGLCEAVSGEEDSQQILRYLKEENLFLIALDDENHWYRYNLLFASLLQHRLRESRSDEMPGLYLKASEWCERQDLLAEAIDYALKGGLERRAAGLISQSAQALITRGEVQTFTRRVERLPEDLLLQMPSLGNLYAWALLVTGEQQQTAAALLEAIQPADAHSASQKTTVRAIAAVYEGRVDESVKLSRQALEELPADDVFFRNLAAWNLSGALAVQGKVEAAMEMLQTVIQNSLATGNSLVAIITLCRLATAEMHKGRLHRAKGIFDQALEIARRDPKGVLPAGSEALMGLGRIHWEWGELEPALRMLEESIQLSKRWREFTILDSYISAAHILQTMGDREGAECRMAEAKRIAASTLATQADDRYVSCQLAHLRLRQGDLEAARRWAVERDLPASMRVDRLETSANLGSEVILRLELVVFGRYLLASEDPEAALHALRLALPLLEQMNFYQKVLEVHLLQAECLHVLGERESAQQALNTAVEMARAEGYRRVFLEEGDRMKRLLRELAVQGDGSGFAFELLKTVEQGETGKQAAQSLVEPLSERETEVLGMLRSELSGPEIAGRLHISVTTLRAHTRSIYAKLGAHSRFEAVSKGEELGIL